LVLVEETKQKKLEINRNKQKQTETNRNKQKQTETNRNKQKQNEFRNDTLAVRCKQGFLFSPEET